ncbi:hypothetical protein D9756_006076 [Leucocoprinus leucothites]|uniref:Uncharacterized protein n=1 Tax=Leucocoprinus leucothites TaxID=201217 RepID=A0A8H5D2M4_9AGAR|nr:hypothetical protein D9756_006076 [Leucoagaricus leucothites]
MKFSTSFVVLAFVFSKTAIALPVDADAFDLVGRDLTDSYDLEARGFYDNVYKERSLDEAELFEREMLGDEFEARDLDARGKSGHSPSPPTSHDPKPAPSKPKPGKHDSKGTCKKPKFRVGKRSLSTINSRTVTGQTITVGGKQYKLGEAVSGNGGEETFMVDGGKAFAKRPKKKGNAPPAFTTEVSNTKKASDALHSGLFVAEGTFGEYHWLITGAMPGGEIMGRWFQDKAKFATKKACEDDMADARKAIKEQQEKLAHAGVGVHADSHPGNWFVPQTGKITTALPIDFGIVMPASTNIDKLLTDQYKYPQDTWNALKDCDICKP